MIKDLIQIKNERADVFLNKCGLPANEFNIKFYDELNRRGSFYFSDGLEIADRDMYMLFVMVKNDSDMKAFFRGADDIQKEN